jgi:hypothetical protein
VLDRDENSVLGFRNAIIILLAHIALQTGHELADLRSFFEIGAIASG